MDSTSLIEISSREDLLNAAQRLRNHLPRSIKLLNNLLVTLHSDSPTDWKYYIDHDITEQEVLILLKIPWDDEQIEQRGRISLFCTPGLNYKMKNYLEDILDWSINMKFCGIDEFQVDMVRSLCQEKGNIDFEIPTSIFTLWPNKSLPVNDECAEVEVRPVDPQSAGMINSFWKHRDEGTQDMIKKLCQKRKVFGAFYKEDELPVAWMFEYPYGAFGNLYTRSEFRGRCLASKVVQSLTADAMSRGIEPYVHIEEDNAISMELFTKLGFTKQTKACWIVYSNRVYK